MTADAAEPFHVLCGQRADDAGCAQRRADIQADDAGKSVRRPHEIGVSLVRQRNIGGVAAVAAHERVVFHARLARRAMLDFCIHALFRMIHGHPSVVDLNFLQPSGKTRIGTSNPKPHWNNRLLVFL